MGTVTAVPTIPPHAAGMGDCCPSTCSGSCGSTTEASCLDLFARENAPDPSELYPNCEGTLVGSAMATVTEPPMSSCGWDGGDCCASATLHVLIVPATPARASTQMPRMRRIRRPNRPRRPNGFNYVHSRPRYLLPRRNVVGGNGRWCNPGGWSIWLLIRGGCPASDRDASRGFRAGPRCMATVEPPEISQMATQRSWLGVKATHRQRRFCLRDHSVNLWSLKRGVSDPSSPRSSSHQRRGFGSNGSVPD